MIELSNFTVKIEGRELFSPINLTLHTGITVLMGKSGIGKSSIISAINGSIEFVGNIKTPKTFTIFQDSHQLFPWYMVGKNLELVCNRDCFSTVNEWKLTDLLDKKPNQISGGQRQRFTLIRALYSGREVLLCDEPLSGIDAVTRYQVLCDFKRKVKQLKLTVLYVSHDLNEAKLIGDKILLLKTDGISEISEEINEENFIKQLGN